MVLRRRYFMPVLGGFAEARLTRMMYAFIELLAGLFLVVGHNLWSSAPAAIISFIGWMTVAEAAAYLLLPDEAVDRFVRTFNAHSPRCCCFSSLFFRSPSSPPLSVQWGSGLPPLTRLRVAQVLGR